jgi:hypothetical protein
VELNFNKQFIIKGGYKIKMKKQFLAGMIITLLMLGIVASASANLIQNGSFELRDIAPYSIAREAPADWTVGSNPGIIVRSSYAGVASEDGLQYYDLGNDAAVYVLSQNFSIVDAGTYKLEWYDASFGAVNQSPYSISVTPIGADQIFSQDFNVSGGTDWTKHDISASLGSGSYTLLFAAKGVYGGFDTLLDNVSLTLTEPDDPTHGSVPEPATMLLLGSGLVGLAGFRKKFLKK